MMPSDIDELLECIQAQEREWRNASRRCMCRNGPCNHLSEADRRARWIAAVEDLVFFKANHTGGLVGINEILAGDGVEIVLDAYTPEARPWRSD